MRRLMLLRHAESTRPKGVPDIERPLSARGRDAALFIGTYLATEHLVPDLALVSPARRARETWTLVRQRIGLVREDEDARIHDATADRLLAIVHETDPQIGVLLVVGHNPGFEDLAARLVGFGDRDARERLMRGYPAAAVAVIDFEPDEWPQAGLRRGRLDRFVAPHF